MIANELVRATLCERPLKVLWSAVSLFALRGASGARVHTPRARRSWDALKGPGEPQAAGQDSASAVLVQIRMKDGAMATGR